MTEPDRTVAALVAELEGLGVKLWEEEGQLRFRAPRGVITDARRECLRDHKPEVLTHLRNAAEQAVLSHDADSRHDPFPLTDVQAAYLLGRRDVFAYGGVGCHGYGELAFAELDPARLEAAWDAVVRRHDMLRAVIGADGSQRVMRDVPACSIPITDLRGCSAEVVDATVTAARDDMDHRVYEPGNWPLFDLRVTLVDDRAVLHFSIDFLVSDFVSIQLILDELHDNYFAPQVERHELPITFRDYLEAERAMRSGARYERDRDYWMERIDDLPAAPELPVVDHPTEHGGARFRRWQLSLDDETWNGLRHRAGTHGVTASTAVLAAYAEVVARWSRKPEFTLDLTLLQRFPLHPSVNDVVGDFTSVELLAVRHEHRSSLQQRAQALQEQLWDDLDHRLCSGVEVLREIARRHGQRAALFPIVFTSAIGLQHDRSNEAGTARGDQRGELVYGISQTPQVWIDCQVMERAGTLSLNWDVREGVFPEGLVDDMFGAFECLLRDMACNDDAWSATSPITLPETQAECRRAVNDTVAPLPDGLLHERVIAQALRTPDSTAVVQGDVSLTYRELAGRAIALASRLREGGCGPGENVAIVMDKGWEQVVGVLATLVAGAAYVPIDTIQPPARRNGMLSTAHVRHALSQSWIVADDWPEGVERIAVDTVAPTLMPTVVPPRRVDPDDLAYVIYTSGSTGDPKGVMISHRAALNTIVDIDRRFGIDAHDRVLGLANLGFDLSVYDVFGPLALGGTLVLPDAGRRGDPSHWADLVARHGVTLWNSVPAQLQMLQHYLASDSAVDLPTLRLALLSGDWIPVTLPDQIRSLLPRLSLVSLGGATEAAIWSIYHRIGEVPPDARSIRYGKPLANQQFHVLDEGFAPRPDWAAGELYIGGAGLAMGYLGDAVKTAERFVTLPATGERLYRTGDLGRYLPDGEIEFLGRDDFQVKIRGHRIELAEVEAALLSHPSVGAATVIVDGDRPIDRRLAAFVETARHACGSQPPARRGIDRAEAAAAGMRAIAHVDADTYLAYSRALDDVALLSMQHALQQRGLFAYGDSHTPECILAAVAPRHHRLVRRWLGALVENDILGVDAGSGRYFAAKVVEAPELTDAWGRVEALQLAVSAEHELFDYFRRCAQTLPDLLAADSDPLQLLFPEGRVDVSDALYRDAVVSRWSTQVVASAVRDVAANFPTDRPLRVLEVGAGVGGTSADVIEALSGRDVDYLFTDLSQFFLNEARTRFADRSFVRFGVFDIDGDARAQGLTPNTFDLVVAADVLHSSRDVDRAVAQLSELLSPDGLLVFIEMTRDHYQIMTSLELMVRVDDATGDFEDVRKGRDQTFLARQQWFDVLDRCGADLEWCLPDESDLMAEIGMHVFVSRVKTDRRRIDPDELGVHLKGRLPEYMIPAQLQIVDALPLTQNGKVDHKRLRAWLPGNAGDTISGPGAEPIGELECSVARVWAEVLGIDAVGRDQDFFALGGDSLLAAQLAGRLREEIPEAFEIFFDDLLRAVLEGPTVAGLAAVMSAPIADGASIAPEVARSDESSLVALAGHDDGTPWVFVHDATGTLSVYDACAAALGELGTVIGLRVADTAAYLALDPATLVARHSADLAQALLRAGHTKVRIAGCDVGGVLATEVARHLTEAGAVVESLTVIGGVPTDDVPFETLAVHSRRAAAEHAVAAYAGDIQFVRPGDAADLTAAWADICLGDLQVVDVPGDHESCMSPALCSGVVHALAQAHVAGHTA